MKIDQFLDWLRGLRQRKRAFWVWVRRLIVQRLGGMKI